MYILLMIDVAKHDRIQGESNANVYYLTNMCNNLFFEYKLILKNLINHISFL